MQRIRLSPSNRSKVNLIKMRTHSKTTDITINLTPITNQRVTRKPFPTLLGKMWESMTTRTICG